jgi:hypothetical protein
MALHDEIRRIHTEVADLTDSAASRRSDLDALDRQLTALWTALELVAARIDDLASPTPRDPEMQSASV